MLCNTNPHVWQWILDNLLTDEEIKGGITNVVLLKDGEGSMDGVCKQTMKSSGKWKQEDQLLSESGTTDISQIYNEEGVLENLRLTKHIEHEKKRGR